MRVQRQRAAFFVRLHVVACERADFLSLHRIQDCLIDNMSGVHVNACEVRSQNNALAAKLAHASWAAQIQLVENTEARGLVFPNPVTHDSVHHLHPIVLPHQWCIQFRD